MALGDSIARCDLRRNHHLIVAYRAITLYVALGAATGLSFAAEASHASCESCECAPITVTAIRGRPGWSSAESRNFRVVCHASDGEAKAITKHCEQLRSALCAYWFPNHDPTHWHPRCEIVVHRGASSYLSAVGRGAASTSGSADVKFDADAIVARRIDLRADRPRLLTASLPHEMTHVVLADWTKGNPLPLWADEGMAILADSAEKQHRHRQDLASVLGARSALSVAELLTSDDYPSNDRWPAFYAQSHSLVCYLVARESPARFITFLESAAGDGYDKALKEQYEIHSVSSLQLAWGNQGRRNVTALSSLDGTRTRPIATAPVKGARLTVATQ